MKILIISDTHLKDPDSLPYLPFDEFDSVIHAGDFDSYEVYEYIDKYDLHGVQGNADSSGIVDELPVRNVVEYESVKIGITHGHTVSSGQELEYVAMELGADLLVYGHSHRPSYAVRSAGLLNPGSPTKPRGSPSVPTYAELELDNSRYEGAIRHVETSEKIVDIKYR